MKRILDKILEVNKVEKLDAFFSYSGHTNQFDVSVNKDAQYSRKEGDKKIYSRTIYLDRSETSEHTLISIIKDLEGLIND